MCANALVVLFLWLFFLFFSHILICLFWFILFHYYALNVCVLSKDRMCVNVDGRNWEELGKGKS